MSARLQRLLLFTLMVYFTLFGGTFYTERSPVLHSANQVITGLVLIAWLVNRWRSRRGLPTTPLDRPLLLYGGAWLLAAVFALDARVSLEYTWPILAHILGFYLLVDLMRQGRQRWIMEALFTAGAVVVLLGIIEFASWYFGLPLASRFVQGWPEIGLPGLPPLAHKLSLALNVSTLLGNFTATLIPLVAAWAMSVRLRDLRFGLWLLAAGLTLILALTGSRGALMALGTSTGVLVLTWLLRDDVRARFPAIMRPLLRRRVLIGVTALALVGFIAGIYLFTFSGNLSTGDMNRLDLWRSAVAMITDHPLTGVGPYQYGSALRWYGDPFLAEHQDRLVTAHNLPLHTLAESGILGGAASLLLAVVFARVWFARWRGATVGYRRRLEGGLAALAGFGVQSMVDTFTITPLIVPVLIIAAYTLEGDKTRAQWIMNPPSPTPGRQRAALAALGVTLAAQIALLPLHAGNLAYNRSLTTLANGDLPAAQDAVQAAQAADPWLALYPLHEAYILGLRANQDAAAYLDAAIAAHESAQALNPTWDTGWHNLGALYAQAGRYDNAIDAAETAITWNPTEAGYYLKLGEYHEALGDFDAARDAYFAMLRWNPNIGSSSFWTDPAHPERADVLQDAVDLFVAEGDPETALHLATAAGDAEAATAVAQTVDVDTAPYTLLRLMGDWAILVDDESIAPCPACYFVQAMALTDTYSWVDYGRLAEIALNGDGIVHELGMTAEQAARLSLLLSEERETRNWYVLARLADAEGADFETVNAMLVRAVPPLYTKQEFSLSVYGRVAGFDHLPQGRTPVLYRYEYEPWFWLAERFEAAGDYTQARRVYEVLLSGDPYLWEVREHLGTLPE